MRLGNDRRALSFLLAVTGILVACSGDDEASPPADVGEGDDVDGVPYEGPSKGGLATPDGAARL